MDRAVLEFVLGETALRLDSTLFGWRTVVVLLCRDIVDDEFALLLFPLESCRFLDVFRVTFVLVLTLLCCLDVFLEIFGTDLAAGADLAACCLVCVLLERLLFFAAAKMDSFNKSRLKTSIINAVFVIDGRFNEFCRFFGVNMIILLSSLFQLRPFCLAASTYIRR